MRTLISKMNVCINAHIHIDWINVQYGSMVLNKSINIEAVLTPPPLIYVMKIRPTP